MPLPEFPLTSLTPTIAAVLELPAPAAAQQPPIAAIVADLRPAQRLAVLAPELLTARPKRLRFLIFNTPGRLVHHARSLLLRSVMPTITPVNFAAMVTGAEMSVHGVQTRNDDFKCETFFDVIRAHGGQSAGVGQSDYTGSTLLGRHADLWGTAENNTDAGVETIALNFAREARPQFMIVQLGSTDDIFHQHGPTSPEVVPALRETDARLERMVGELAGLGYAVIVTADHGQHDCEPESGRGGTHGSAADEDALVPCTWVKPTAR